jgi:hypothetical protein
MKRFLWLPIAFLTLAAMAACGSRGLSDDNLPLAGNPLVDLCEFAALPGDFVAEAWHPGVQLKSDDASPDSWNDVALEITLISATAWTGFILILWLIGQKVFAPGIEEEGMRASDELPRKRRAR